MYWRRGRWTLAGGKRGATAILLVFLPFSCATDLAAITRADLDRSLELGTAYLLSNQTEEGNFVYIYNLVAKKPANQDGQVRQAGALWGLSLIHLDRPSEKTRQAIEKGLAFFHRNSKKNEAGARYVVYPGDGTGRTGTVSLVTLALIDFLRAEEGEQEISSASRETYLKYLDESLEFLLSVRKGSGHFAVGYDYRSGTGAGGPSPYFDGETLLALTKAAKYIPGHEGLKDSILESALAMRKLHVDAALEKHPDSSQTKGFFQWGILSYYELFTSGWTGTQPYGRRAIDLAHWMIDVHKTLIRTKNTAYAMEGIATAHEIARLRGDGVAQNKFAGVLDKALSKLTSWQAGHPLQNKFLQLFPEFGQGLGGVMNSEHDPEIRVDVVQHQMHAVLLARRYVYPIESSP